MIERNLRDVAQATWGDAFKLDQRTVTKAAVRAGVEGNVSPHWLRHTRATHALEWGALVLLVQAAVGHAAVATAGRYLHARPIDSSWTYLAF